MTPEFTHSLRAHLRRVIYAVFFCFILIWSGGCSVLGGETNCFDGKDNDEDGDIDFADVDCRILDLLDFLGFNVDDFAGTVTVGLQVTDQPNIETLTVGADGCVMAHCGCFCDLTPGASVVIVCGKHAVLFIPGAWGFNFGFWQRLGAPGTGSIAKMPDPPNAPPQRFASTLDEDQLCAFEARNMPNEFGTYDVEMRFTRPVPSPKAEVLTFLPVVSLKEIGAKGPAALASINPAPVAAELPIQLSDIIVSPTADDDLSVHIFPVAHYVGDGGGVRFKVFVANHGSTAAMNPSISGSLTNVSFDASLSPGVVHDGAPVGGTFDYSTAQIDPLSTMKFEVAGSCAPGASSCSADITVTGISIDPDPADNTAAAVVQAGSFADIRVERIDTEQNPQLEGVDNTFTITIRNRGPVSTTADVQVDVQGATLQSASEGMINGNQLWLATPPLDAHQKFQVTLVVNPLTGAVSTSVTAQLATDSPGVTDSDLTNDLLVIDVPTTSVTRSPEILFASHVVRDWMGGQTSTGTVPGIGNTGFLSFGKPYVSADGDHWAFQTTIVPDLSTGSDTAFVQVTENGVRASTTVFQLSSSTIPEIQDMLNGVDSKISVNDDGCVGLTGQRLTGGNRVAVNICGDNLPGGSGTSDVLAQQGDTIPGMPGFTFPNNRFVEPNILNDGSMTFLAGITPATTATDNIVVNVPASGNAMILVQEGTTIPTGQAGGAMETIQNFDTETFSNRSGVYATGDGQHFMVRGDLGGPFAGDDVLIVDNVVVLQEGQTLPGMASPISNPLIGGYLAHNGDWYARGNNSDGAAWIVKNGLVIHATGDEIVPGGTEHWMNFRFVAGDNMGRYVVSGHTVENDDLLFVYHDNIDPPREIIRSGEPVDADRNGKFDDQLFALLSTANDNAIMLSGERLVVPITVAGSDSFANVVGSVIALFELNPQPLPGDGDDDGDVDFRDFYLFQDCYGKMVMPGDPCAVFDFNEDMIIDLRDYVEFLEVVMGPL